MTALKARIALLLFRIPNRRLSAWLLNEHWQLIYYFPPRDLR